MLSSYFLNAQEQPDRNFTIFILSLVVKYLNFPIVADCCDGSDEYDGLAKCANTCWEAGKASREKLARKVNVYKEGLKIRRSEIESGKKLRQQSDITLTALRKEEKLLNEQVQKLKGWSLKMLSENVTVLMLIVDQVRLILEIDVILSTSNKFLCFGA